MMEALTTTKPRIAFIGVGWIGRHRMQAALDTGLAELAGVADTSEDCINDAKKISQLGRVYSSFEEAVDDGDVDAIVIATPSALHMEQAVLALEKGKAVFCQKPLGRNASEVKAVVQAALDADRLLGADFSYRHTNAFRAVHETIESGDLGEVYAAELKFHNAYGPGKPWFYDIKQAGGGCVLDLGVHLIDLLLYAFDFPRFIDVKSRLFAGGQQITSLDRVEDYADVMIGLENGVHAHLSCSWNLHAGTEAVIECTFYGTKGGAALRNINGSFYDFEAVKFNGTQSHQISAPPDNWGGKAIADWLEQLSLSNRFHRNALNYVASAEIIDKVYERN